MLAVSGGNDSDASPRWLGARLPHVLVSGISAAVTPAFHRRLCVQRAVLAEAQIVAPRIDDVERTLTPRAGDHCASRFAVDVIRREHIEPFRALVHRVDVVDGEEERLRFGRLRYTAVRDVEDG